MINRLAAESLPADVPAFLRTPEAINEIAYLGPEPDRWRSRAEPELVAAQAPDHFIDMELADLIGPLPRQRYQYIAALYAYAAAHPEMAQQMRPEKVGFQPYITSEVWERLKSAMRDYRQLSREHQDTKPVEAAILFYAGWLGHYVGDGSQPLHVTVNYNGWAGKENPNGYTTDHTIHWRFEGPFVDAAVNTSEVRPLLEPLHPIGDEWDDYLAYLRHTSSLVERVYHLDKEHGFDGTGTPESRQFTAERLAAGASMLRDLIVAAWVNSAEPVPEWHEEQPAPKTAGTATAEPDETAEKPKASAPAVNPIVNEPYTGKAKEYRFGGDVTAPKLRSAAPGSIDIGNPGGKIKYQGADLVGLVVDENGYPRNIHIERPVGMGLDEKAVEAIRSYVFTPATYKGQPVAVAIHIQVAFRVYGSKPGAQ